MPTFLRRMLSKEDVDASVALHVRDLCGSVGKFEDLLRNGKDEDEVIGSFLEVARRTWVGDGELATKQMVEFFIAKASDLRKERIASRLAIEWLKLAAPKGKR
jgi:hypothetical protein